MYKSPCNLGLYFRFILVWFTFFIPSSYLNSQENWHLVKTDENLKVYTSPEKGSSIRKFKITTLCKGQLSVAEKIFRNLTAMPEWYEGVKSAHLTKRISDNEAEYTLIYGMPFPLVDRVATIRGTMEKSDESILIKTAHFPSDIANKYSKLVRVTRIWSTWEINKKSEGRLEITHTGFMDPSGPVPDWLINLKLTDVPVKTLKNLQKILQESGN